MRVKRCVLATRNLDKVREIKEILGSTEWEIVSLDDFPNTHEIDEDGDTLVENALKKARLSYDWTRLPSIGDDTGLEVDALNGAPGVRSSRFAGMDASYDDNIRKLLDAMKTVPANQRSARFRCVAAFVDGRVERWVEGTCDGVILTERRGKNGFGYDPLFFLPELGKTFAEMTLVEKNKISHRGIAFRKIKELLENYQKEYMG